MRPGVVVTGLTVGAMALVSVLAVQAQGSAKKSPAAAAGSAKPAPDSSPSASPTPTAEPTPTEVPLPAGSGTGLRVVYSPSSHQVWLVDPKKPTPVEASFSVTPGTAEPTPGTYQVYSRKAAGTGTDGRQIEHIVLFAQQGGTVFGFSAAVDGSLTAPDAKAKTGGIREKRADAALLWEFAPSGTHVVVIK